MKTNPGTYLGHLMEVLILHQGSPVAGKLTVTVSWEHLEEVQAAEVLYDGIPEKLQPLIVERGHTEGTSSTQG